MIRCYYWPRELRLVMSGHAPKNTEKNKQQCAAASALLYALVYPNTAVVWLAVLCSVLCVTGAMTTNICPVITQTLFGGRELNEINPIFSGGAFWGGAALATQVIGRVVTATGSFSNGYLTAAAIGVAGMALLLAALVANPMKKQTT